MSNGAQQRNLAAILFTDMVGYSALAQRNERLAVESIPQGQLKPDPVPQGRPTIAQRFIAGSRRPERDKPRRGDRTFVGRWRGPFLSPLRGFGAAAFFPSDKSPGYCLSSSGLKP